MGGTINIQDYMQKDFMQNTKSDLKELMEKQLKEQEEMQKALNGLKKDSCPNCGYCKHCGRSNKDYNFSQPLYPQPFINYPNYPYNNFTCSSNIAGTGGQAYNGTFKT